MSKQIASSIKDFAFETLLMMAIRDEKLHDGEGTEHDPSEGTGFEPVHGVAPALNPSPIPPSSTSRPVSPLSTVSPTNTRSSDVADSDATDSESGPVQTRLLRPLTSASGNPRQRLPTKN